jgi:hypothetical protein
MKLSHYPRELPWLLGPRIPGTFHLNKKEYGRRNELFSRATETFRSELEAKEFAKQKLTETQNISAGTLNPHLPKRVISSAQISQWLEEPTGTDAAP